MIQAYAINGNRAAPLLDRDGNVQKYAALIRKSVKRLPLCGFIHHFIWLFRIRKGDFMVTYGKPVSKVARRIF
jgi:hypothetical protein